MKSIESPINLILVTSMDNFTKEQNTDSQAPNWHTPKMNMFSQEFKLCNVCSQTTVELK